MLRDYLHVTVTHLRDWPWEVVVLKPSRLRDIRDEDYKGTPERVEFRTDVVNVFIREDYVSAVFATIHREVLEL